MRKSGAPWRNEGRMMKTKPSSAGRPGGCWSRAAAVAADLRAFSVPEFIFPSPADRLQLVEFAVPIAERPGDLLGHDGGLRRSAIVVGVLLGFLIGSSRLAYAALYPLMVAFNALPKAAFVPILVVWFGIGVGPAS
jgi:ABC-type nitrate/sulfonate/bicarbonate transport system permease component